MAGQKITDYTETELMAAAMAVALAIESLIAYAITWGPLLIGFLILYPFYIKAFKKHSYAHQTSSFAPLINGAFRILKIGYLNFLILAVASFSLSLSKIGIKIGIYLIAFFVGMALGLVWFTAAYQLMISFLSIYRFINTRQTEQLRGTLSRKNVKVLMIVSYLIVIIKDLSLIAWVLVILASSPKTSGLKTSSLEQSELYNTVILYYSISYFTQQLLLYIGMAFQFSMKQEVTTTHSEIIIAKHTKWIGAVKLTLFVTTVVARVAGSDTIIPETMYGAIDIFLVPVVIQIAEIKTDPNVVTPCEIKKESIEV